MKKIILISTMFACSFLQAETKFNFSGDAYVKGYNINAHNAGNTSTQAFNQFFRLKTEIKPDDNLTLKTGLVLSSESWEGDAHKAVTSGGSGTSIGGTSGSVAANGNVTHLDHAFIEYKQNGWITSVGRQVVSSPGHFLSSDDRRDRIQILKIYPSYDVLALIYDKRAGGSLTDSKDDLDMYSVNYYGIINQHRYALQTGYWVSKKYNNSTSLLNGVVNLDNVKQFTPQYSTTLYGVNLDAYYTILWGGSAYYKDTHQSGALKLTHDFDLLKLEYQSIVTVDGGLVAGGFDSLSSVVNNNPNHLVSSINLRNIGLGLGNKNADEYVHMVRLTKTFGEAITASVGFGCGQLYVTNTSKVEKNTILDTSIKYDFSKNLALNTKIGKFFGDNKDHAESIGLYATF